MESLIEAFTVTNVNVKTRLNAYPPSLPFTSTHVKFNTNNPKAELLIVISFKQFCLVLRVSFDYLTRLVNYHMYLRQR